jgi:hypothetical protein
MTRQRSPWMQGPEGRPLNLCSPARKGWEIDPEEDPSAGGAALNRSSALPVSLGARPRDLQFRGPLLETRNTMLKNLPYTLSLERSYPAKSSAITSCTRIEGTSIRIASPSLR